MQWELLASVRACRRPGLAKPKEHASSATSPRPYLPLCLPTDECTGYQVCTGVGATAGTCITPKAAGTSCTSGSGKLLVHGCQLHQHVNSLMNSSVSFPHMTTNILHTIPITTAHLGVVIITT